MTARLREACRALIVDEPTQRVFLGKRAETVGYAAGRWSLFGGKVDRNESPSQAIIREIREETGWRFAPQPYLVQENDEWRTHFFTGTVAGKLTLRLAEHSEAGYFSLEQIDKVEMAFDHVKVIRAYLQSITQSAYY